MATLNREWHVANPMPKNARLDQRIAWHLSHNINCQCRDIPKTIKMAIKAKKK